MGLEISLIFALILANGLFALAEIAIVSARKARLQQRANNGDKKAEAALALASSPDELLSTTQIGITLIGTLAGAFGGATIAGRIAVHFKDVPAVAPYAETLSVTLVVLLISYLSLILGELVPKRLALTNPERFAAWTAPLMKLLSRVASPAVRFLTWSSSMVLKLIPFRHAGADASITEEEIKVLLEQGTAAGTFEKGEHDLVKGVFHLSDRWVDELMTPRPKVVWLDVNDAPDIIRYKIAGSFYSRFPVADGDLDHVLGVVHVKDLLTQSLAGQAFDLSAVMRRPLIVPETTRALSLLDQFQESGTHIALVISEHGGVEGLVTLNDILETVVGSLPSDEEPAPDQAVQREDGSWLVDGMMSALELRGILGLRDRLPGEDDSAYTTVGGFVMHQLGRIPSVADAFEWEHLRFEVMDMDGNRVDRVLVKAVVPAATDSAGS